MGLRHDIAGFLNALEQGGVRAALANAMDAVVTP